MRAAQLNHQLAASGLVHQPAICQLISQATGAMNRYRHISIEMAPGGSCKANIKGEVASPPSSELDEFNMSNEALFTLGYRLDKKNCLNYEAFVGAMPMPYKLCTLNEIKS